MRLVKRIIALTLPFALAGCMLPGTYNFQQSSAPAPLAATCPDGSAVQADGTCASQDQPAQPVPAPTPAPQPIAPIPTPYQPVAPVPAPYQPVAPMPYDHHMHKEMKQQQKEMKKEQKEIQCLREGTCGHKPAPAPAPTPAPAPHGAFIGGVPTPPHTAPGYVGGVPTPHQGFVGGVPTPQH